MQGHVIGCVVLDGRNGPSQDGGGVAVHGGSYALPQDEQFVQVPWDTHFSRASSYDDQLERTAQRRQQHTSASDTRSMHNRSVGSIGRMLKHARTQINGAQPGLLDSNARLKLRSRRAQMKSDRLHPERPPHKLRILTLHGLLVPCWLAIHSIVCAHGGSASMCAYRGLRMRAR